jgi:non-ribosomal peptide synthetase component E (peptide arylation enzyme)
MILGAGGHGPTLDDLFRRAGVRHPHAIALADPPNRMRIDGCAPRILTFTQADRAISAFAARLRGLGLQADAVIGLQLPNTVESVIALLGVLRAGMIAAPLPLLWRKRDLLEALPRAGASAIVAAGKVGDISNAAIAVEVAAELFAIRFVCAFGATDVDGVIPLDDIFEDTATGLSPPPHRERLGAHVAVLTCETRADGLRLIARSHAQLVASGRGIAAECGLANDAPLLSAIPLASFAGLSTALVPWLIGGGALHLHHGFDAESFAAQCAALDGGAVVVPGPALPALAASLKSAGAVIALWRSPERMASAPALRHSIIDVACFGESRLIATQRDRDGAILPLPSGADTQRTKVGTLALRALGTVCDAFPPPDDRTNEAAGAFVDTGFPCQVDADRGTLTVTGSPAGLALVGGYAFPRTALDTVSAEAGRDASIIAVPDGLLGERLAGHAAHRQAAEAELEKRGYNPLITRAFRPRVSTSTQF